ncbi:MAG: cyclic nucleotide-binding domain-containing protein [Polyangiales bacterium]
MPTIADLKERADRALFEEQYLTALQLYATIVALQPGNLDARLRVGDALLALGEAQPAAAVYTALARNAALAGYPLRSLVALKLLGALEPNLSALEQEVARLYARESYRVGQSTRRTLPAPSDQVEDEARVTPTERPALVRYAQQIGERYQRDAVFYPERLMPIPLLSLLPEAALTSALQLVQLVRVRPDTWILRQGDPGSSFFVLARGALEVTIEREGEEMKVAQLLDGAVFGEMVLLSDAPRTASVRTVSDCDLLMFDRDRLRNATVTMQHLKPAIQGFIRDRLLTSVTATSPLFRLLDPRQRHDLVRRFIGVEHEPDQEIIHEGGEGAGLYVVLRGSVNVLHGRSRVAQLGPAELFGEISLIRRTPTSASVRSGDQGASLLFLHRDYFQRLIAAVPELRGYLERLSEDRLNELRARPSYPELDVVGEEVDVELLF